LAAKSVWNRRVTAGLTVLAVALSVAMLLGVEKLRRDAREAFTNTISGTDLIVGARSGAVQLLLYSVFRIGNATNNITWESYEELARHPRIAWTVPISLGDSHRGYRVMGTTRDYFERYRYAGRESLRFRDGEPFEDVFDAVLGAEVADRLGYVVGDKLIVGHGYGEVSFAEHEDKPFRAAGILARTGTPADRTVHVSLAGIEAMHVDWQSGAPVPSLKVSAEDVRTMNLEPKANTAVMVGLKSKASVFKVQRYVNEFPEEPLLAIIPGVALQELWDLMSIVENALLVISAMVVVSGMLGMLTVILSSLEARRREMAVLRSVGARPVHIFALFMSEAGLLTLVGVLAGVLLLYGLVLMGQPIAAREFGLYVPIRFLQIRDLIILGAVVCAGFVVGILPAIRAYRLSLADGLSLRV